MSGHWGLNPSCRCQDLAVRCHQRGDVRISEKSLTSGEKTGCRQEREAGSRIWEPFQELRLGVMRG